MEMKDIIAKVNYYAGIAKERELTEQEAEERKKYRAMYMQQFRAQMRGHLDTIKFVEDEDPKVNN